MCKRTMNAAVACAAGSVTLVSASIASAAFTDNFTDPVATAAYWTQGTYSGNSENDSHITQPVGGPLHMSFDGTPDGSYGNGGPVMATPASTEYNFFNHVETVTLSAPTTGVYSTTGSLMPQGTATNGAWTWLGLRAGSLAAHTSSARPDANNSIYVGVSDQDLLAFVIKGPSGLVYNTSTYNPGSTTTADKVTGIWMSIDGTKESTTGDIYFDFGINYLKADGTTYSFDKFNSLTLAAIGPDQVGYTLHDKATMDAIAAPYGTNGASAAFELEQIASNSTNVQNIDVRQFASTSTPEPASLGLLAAGAAGLLRRRRK